MSYQRPWVVDEMAPLPGLRLKLWSPFQAREHFISAYHYFLRGGKYGQR
jgi:hypothetical protein